MKPPNLSVALIGILSFFLSACSTDNEKSSHPDNDPSSEIMTGGDNTYEMEEKEQVEVFLQVQNFYDSLGDVVAQSLYFENWNDTINVFSNIHPENEVYEQGVYKVWLQHIDRGSIGPFVTFLDSTIEFVKQSDSILVYDFRID